MHNRRSIATAGFLAVVAVSFVVSTITSTATSSPQPVPVTSSTAPAPTTTSTRPAPAPTTTVVVPATSTSTSVVPPVPTTIVPPAPTLEAPATPVAAPTDLLLTARETLDSVVPHGWFGSADLQWALVDGSSSLARDIPPTIKVGTAHFENPAKLRFILAHEWAHHVAFRHGDPDQLSGHPPIGFDAHGIEPEEMWAGCVAEVLVPEYWISTHGLPRCAPSALEFTARFLAAGPY